MCNNCELLQLATLRLAQDGSLKDRLAEAYASHLEALEADQLPPNMREEFGVMCAAMHRESPQPRENPVRASVRKMSAQEAGEYAAFVVKLCVAMTRAEAACAPTTQRVPRAGAPVLQLFAAEA